MPTLDVRCLSDKALANAERIFHDLKHKRMLPFNESDHDPVRHELDRRLLNEVLDITSEDAHNAVHRLRELLCAGTEYPRWERNLGVTLKRNGQN